MLRYMALIVDSAQYLDAHATCSCSVLSAQIDSNPIDKSVCHQCQPGGPAPRPFVVFPVIADAAGHPDLGLGGLVLRELEPAGEKVYLYFQRKGVT